MGIIQTVYLPSVQMKLVFTIKFKKKKKAIPYSLKKKKTQKTPTKLIFQLKYT